MTMQRGSMIFAAEGYQKGTDKDNFGLGRGYYKNSDVRCKWIHAPPGTFFGTDHGRTASAVRAMGTKRWDTVVYGTVTGSFNWTFTMDYEYLHPFIFALEGYDCKTVGDVTTYTFKKLDTKRVRSFTVMRTILNRMAGGPNESDEIEQLLGCVVSRLTLARSAGTSQVAVTMTGMYASERMFKGNLDATDYEDYNGNLTEYMCMFVANAYKTDLPDLTYVANTDQMSLDIENNLARIYTTCSPFASNYQEGLSSYKFSTSIYSNNPEVYKQRVYGGGSQVLPNANHILLPKIKGLKPLPQVSLLTYSDTALTAEGLDNAITQQDIIDAYERSIYTLDITIRDVVIKQLTWPKGEGSKIVDNISSAECKEAEIKFQCRKKDPVTGESIMGEFDLFEDSANADKIKHVCKKPIIESAGGFDW